ncbi:hypothetical protein ACT6P6_22745 [Priestia endophytica]|uniref:hypothetical protein n=1 Tax=Priestia filamentosa TaxID=1402861 RepID=UPI002E200D55|nr:hypothetical protein [Priestia filamentosa]
MWVITVYSEKNKTTMFEFENEEEAREMIKHLQGCRILSEVIYNDPPLVREKR